MRDPQAAATDFFIQRQVVLGLLLLLCVFITGFVGYEGLPYALTRIASTEASGTVTKVDKVNQTRTIWYSFRAVDGEIYERYVSVPSGVPFTTYVGADVEVSYFPLLPSYSDIKSLFQYRRASMVIATGALGVGGLIVLLFLASAWSFKRHKKRMLYY